MRLRSHRKNQVCHKTVALHEVLLPALSVRLTHSDYMSRPFEFTDSAASRRAHISQQALRNLRIIYMTLTKVNQNRSSLVGRTIPDAKGSSFDVNNYSSINIDDVSILENDCYIRYCTQTAVAVVTTRNFTSRTSNSEIIRCLLHFSDLLNSAVHCYKSVVLECNTAT